MLPISDSVNASSATDLLHGQDLKTLVNSLQKTVLKSVIDSCTFTSHSSSNFERFNISFKENKPDGVDLNSKSLTTMFERTKQRFYGFWQTVIT